MCGIIGIFPADESEAASALQVIAHRGADGSAVEPVGSGWVGHVLHSLVGDVAQPLHGDGTLLFNGEIYNWRELADREGISADNDAQLLLHLLDARGAYAIPEIVDGVYAFAYIRDGVAYLQRDVLGVKPLWYASGNRFAFASEAKALTRLDLLARELHPRTTLEVDLASGETTASVRELAFGPVPDASLDDLLIAAVEKRVPESGRVGILFSGGIDSSLLAMLSQRTGADVTLYVAALDDPDKAEPHDLASARQAADQLGLPLVEVRATLEQVEALIPCICEAIESANPVKVGVALPFWLCAERARADDQRVLFSGLGAEEVFAGYARHKRAVDVDAECLRGLRAMHERDLQRDDIVGMMHTLEIRLPLLDHAVITKGLAIPGSDKIVDGMGKMPLRQAAKRLGLPERIAMRPKKAAQYGSQFDAAIGKLARAKGSHKGEYLRSVHPRSTKLCALLSSGKDSVYALHTMQRMDYEIACCATIIPENPDSYMYHAPLASLAEQQADAMGLPWLSERTAGVKEEELAALERVLERAIQEHGIQGVVSGALFSEYQRSRIERVCEGLGLRVYAPLWHIDQEQEVREIIDAGFEFILVRVAAQGLDRSFLGRPITHGDVDRFRDLLHLNVAGEGGEYESLVLDGPNFRAPVQLPSHTVVCQEGSVDVCELRLDM